MEDLRHSLKISVWVRWFVVIAWLAQLHYRANFEHPAYIPHMAFAVSALALNGWVHYRIESGRSVTWRWALALSAMDAAMITGGIATAGGFDNNFFVLYYAALAMFAVAFTSFKISFAGATAAAVVYAAVSLAAGDGVDFGIKEEKVLFMRIVVMYAVAAAVNLVSRFERIRRRQAVERERELQRERVELSQTIHNTIAQSAYAIGLGLETAIELAKSGNDEANREELATKLQAIYEVSKSTMWELRHPIDMGPMFEGRELSRALQSHVSTFSTIASIPAEMIQSGDEPQLSSTTRRLLFSIAHNALTNALRHSNAGKVTVSLNFDQDEIRLAVLDDGIGVPDDLRRTRSRFQKHGRRRRAHGRQFERIIGRIRSRRSSSLRGSAARWTRWLSWEILGRQELCSWTDHAIMRDGLREVLERSGDFEVVGQASDGEAAVGIAQSVEPDVIIMDVVMPVKNGIDACREISEILPDARVLILTAAPEEDAATEAVAAGAAGYLQKYSGKDEFAARRPPRGRGRIQRTRRRDTPRVLRNENGGAAKLLRREQAYRAREADTVPIRAGPLLRRDSRHQGKPAGNHPQRHLRHPRQTGNRD